MTQVPGGKKGVVGAAKALGSLRKMPKGGKSSSWLRRFGR
jgi:hypothetical protein